MERKTLDAMLTLAGIDPVAVHQLANKYWPDCHAYAQLRRDNPWWLVLTKAGPVVIGRRKRVISINWAETGIRAKMTADDQTTSELEYCHAWTYEKAVEYLSTLQSALKLAASSVSESQTAQIVELENLIAERDRLRENENLFRRLLADRSGLQFVSRDDGGLQAEANCIDFDFLRDTPQELQRKFHSLVVSRLTSSGPNAGRVKPLQEKTELDRLRDVLKKANDQAERFEREWYLRGDELDRLRAGIEAALVEIELQRQDPGAFDYPATIAWEQASDAAAEIVRKHTGVTP